MKALSVRQPWACALVSHLAGSPIGDKRVENRTWRINYRGDLLIVSSAKMAEDAAYASDRIEWYTGVRLSLDDPYMARGYILGIVKVMACLDLATYERVRTYSIDHDVAFATVAGAVDRGSMSVNHLSRTTSPWAAGPYCWCVENVRRLPPTQAQGRLGLYNLDTVHGIPVDEWVKREAVRV